MMRTIWLWGLLWGLRAAWPVAAGEPADLRETSAVIDALKSRFVDADQLNTKTLNEATVAGLLQAIGRGAVLVTNDAVPTPPPPPAAGPLARVEVVNPAIGYIRLADVVAETVPAIDEELKKFAAEKVEGYVLDLRFADGTNYAAAAQVASRFLPNGQTLFAVKKAAAAPEMFRAGPLDAEVAPGLTTAPLMVLVNGETRGGAETLAAALQARQRGIIIGAKTAGTAVAWEDVRLTDGRLLRIATAKVVLPAADGTMSASVFPDGITPDIPVKIDPQVERDVIFNATTNVTLTASLQPRYKKKGMSEADLVKVFRGEAVDLPSPATRKSAGTNGEKNAEDEELQPVKDVVLQRAVDVLKGIRALLSWQAENPRH